MLDCLIEKVLDEGTKHKPARLRCSNDELAKTLAFACDNKPDSKVEFEYMGQVYVVTTGSKVYDTLVDLISHLMTWPRLLEAVTARTGNPNCGGRVRYKKSAINKAIAKVEEKFGYKTTAYKCPECLGYHLTRGKK